MITAVNQVWGVNCFLFKKNGWSIWLIGLWFKNTNEKKDKKGMFKAQLLAKMKFKKCTLSLRFQTPLSSLPAVCWFKVTVASLIQASSLPWGPVILTCRLSSWAPVPSLSPCVLLQQENSPNNRWPHNSGSDVDTRRNLYKFHSPTPYKWFACGLNVKKHKEMQQCDFIESKCFPC